MTEISGLYAGAKLTNHAVILVFSRIFSNLGNLGRSRLAGYLKAL